MSVPFKNRTATIHAVGQEAGVNGVLGNPAPAGASVQVRGYMEPTTPSRVFKDWTVETKSPQIFYCDLGDANSWPLNAEVTVNGQLFTVAAPVKRWEGGGITDHCEVLLDSLKVGKPS